MPPHLHPHGIHRTGTVQIIGCTRTHVVSQALARVVALSDDHVLAAVEAIVPAIVSP